MCELENECTSHNSIVLAIGLPKITKFGTDLMKFWQKQFGTFFGPLYAYSSVYPPGNLGARYSPLL